jgi:hypothetical protein
VADHGMLFVDSLARAILRGEKIVTRRPLSRANTVDFDRIADVLAMPIDESGFMPQPRDCRVTPGDTLWVREAWRVIPSATECCRVLVGYRAGGAPVVRPTPDDVGDAELGRWSRRNNKNLPCWTPSLLMPRWAARSVRRVLAVHAERLGPLTKEQARDEGFGSPIEFTNTWDAVYRSKGQTVAARPWVWCIRFAGLVE